MNSGLNPADPGRSCGLVALNAVSFGHNDIPMAAGSCLRRGVAGVFAESGGTWQAPGAGGGYDALAASGSVLTVWRLASAAWAKVQVIHVPIEYGSSS